MKLFNLSVSLYTFVLLTNIGILSSVKYSIGDLHTQLNNINNEIYKINNTIQVLEAEWSYLTQPSILEKLAKKYLNLQPILYTQVSSNLDTEYTFISKR